MPDTTELQSVGQRPQVTNFISRKLLRHPPQVCSKLIMWVNILRLRVNSLKVQVQLVIQDFLKIRKQAN